MGCAGASSSVAAPPGEWLAGDLHVHTTYSHDSYGGPGDDNTGIDDLNTLGLSVGGQFALAATRRLDYLAITDHNDVRSQSDPGFGTAGVIAVPGYENSLNTHAQMLGAQRLYDNGDKSLEAVLAIADALHADGGAFQVNHPSSPDWAYGYGVPADSSEVWNLPWYYQPPFPAAADNDRALAFWQGWLDTGAKIAAVGGSDSHWAYTSPAQGVGQPTTWVYARERTPAGVLEGLRAGRTFVSHQPPAYAGPQVFLEADADGDGSFESMVGDTVAPGTRLRARVTGGAGAFARVVIDGGREAFAPVAVDSPNFERGFVVPADATWVHVQLYGEDVPSGREAGCTTIPAEDLTEAFAYCTNRIAMLALTSAIFLRPEAAQGGPGGSEAVPRGRARLAAPRRCVRRTLRASVRGRHIQAVTYLIDGRRVKRVRQRENGRFVLRRRARRIGRGRHRLVARVRFTAASAGRAKRISRGFRVCGRLAAVRPKFTG